MNSSPVAVAQSPLLRALRCERPERLPVWFMRQAGRSLPEYRELRRGVKMLDACLNPEMAAEITLQPIRRHGVDAAIFFSDIVVPLVLAGIDIDIVPGTGPVLVTPIRTPDDVAALTDHELSSQALEPIRAAVGLAVSGLKPQNTPLIGFGGAPFTLAAYLVEGGPSRDYLAARAMMHSDPKSWERLTSWVATITGQFLTAQVEAGAQAVQLFDSWAGALSLQDYRERVAPASVLALKSVAPLGVPAIHFGVGTGHLLNAMSEVLEQAEVQFRAVGVDYRTPLDQAASMVGNDVAVQGNIDPALLAAPWPVLEAHVRDVAQRGRAAAGHVVNLGHGVPPGADPAVLTRIVELVHSL